eukprot:scaffold188811_cov13-Tisochrysis_lutea.AAC.3
MVRGPSQVTSPCAKQEKVGKRISKSGNLDLTAHMEVGCRRVLAVQGRLQFARQVLGLLDLITIGSAYAGDWRRLFARVILRPGTRVEACREGFEAMMRLAGHKLIPKNLDLLPPGAGQLLSLLE